MKKRFAIAFSISMIAILITTSLVSAAVVKVPVCHIDELGIYHYINISDNAWDSHMAHGDMSPGDPVPGLYLKKFGPDCSEVDMERVFVTSVTVASKGTVSPFIPLPTSYFLDTGVNYEFEASGTYYYGFWTEGFADARCSHRPSGGIGAPWFNNSGSPAWIDGAILGTTYGLQITYYNGEYTKPANPPLSPVGWEPACNMDHIYTASAVGAGENVEFFIWDDNYSDNIGTLLVKIYKYQ